ncbi:DEAD/DEAH box helicase [Ruminiclostridium herbifermentans]|uniref:DEAD/DEAH box helicase n=1 Tax=Ruminiclostridium herbifermentans TaxID=2488810 RepID=A0A4U7JHD4_9FIRM|nr:DEAD/DEAH box helicase [Ruminiclostridium herbifermentans]QNU66011.1 DEAD/DEAH box helicase [Ruminiclostridium herbifermentans]
MNTSFSELGISPPILKALEEMGFEAPTEVQKRAIPHILNKEDLIVMSKTGSGKTAVFGVPMLQLTDSKALEPQGLILTPTRELAVQIDNDIKHYSKYLSHRTTAVYGQHNINIEIQALAKGASIVTGTPGRVFDHIQQGNLKTKHIGFLVLDEADRMLDMGFLDQVVKIIKTIPKDRVTLLFSATMPHEMHKICRNYMKNPVTIEIESQTMTVDTISQVYYRVNDNEKNIQLNRLLMLERPESCIIFCNTRFAVDKVQSFLSRKGYSCHALHGDIPQARRLKTIQQFKAGAFPLLVATDVAARGIHVESLSLVINYDIPQDKDNYVHRIGRTGRAGNDGRALSLVTSDDIMTLYEIEEHIGTMIPEEELPSEDVLNEQKVQCDEWIKSVSHKSKTAPRLNNDGLIKENRKKLSRTASGTSTRTAQNKYSHDKSKQPFDKKSNNKSKSNEQSNLTHNEFDRSQKSQRKANSNKQTAFADKTIDIAPAIQSSTGKTATRKVIRSKTVSTKGRIGTPDSKAAAIANTQSAQSVHGHSAAAQSKTTQPNKKPLLKRIMQRLFGK